MLLVLLDNASAEHAFISSFFRDEPFQPPTPVPSTSSRTLALPPRTEPQDDDDDRQTIDARSGTFSPPRKPIESRSISVTASESRQGKNQGAENEAKARAKEDEESSAALWKQVMEPALSSCEVCSFPHSMLNPFHKTTNPILQALFKTIIEPTPPPVLPLLCMIRLNESALREAQKRAASPPASSSSSSTLAVTPSANSPLEPFMLSIRFRLWPVLQKEMSRHVDSLKKVADGGGVGVGAGLFSGMGFGGGTSTGPKLGAKDDVAHIVSRISLGWAYFALIPLVSDRKPLCPPIFFYHSVERG